MFQGQYLFGSNVAVYSPWFARQGDNIQVVGELIDFDSAGLKIELYTKGSEDAGNGGLLAGSKTITTATIDDHKWTALVKDMVRYKLTCTGTDAAHYILFRMLDPAWYDTVRG